MRAKRYNHNLDMSIPLPVKFDDLNRDILNRNNLN